MPPIEDIEVIKSKHSLIEREVQSLHTDVSILKTVSQTLAEGQKQIQIDMKSGFAEIMKIIGEVSNQKPKLGFDNLAAMIGVLAVGIGAFWAVVNLLVTPLVGTLDKHITRTEPLVAEVGKLAIYADRNKDDIVTNYARADHESMIRHAEQQAQIDELRQALKQIDDRQRQVMIDNAKNHTKP